MNGKGEGNFVTHTLVSSPAAGIGPFCTLVGGIGGSTEKLKGEPGIITRCFLLLDARQSGYVPATRVCYGNSKPTPHFYPFPISK